MNEEMMQFEHAVDLACKSKFIMVDKRISDILKAIASCNEVFEAIKKCMIGFDFGKELRIATTVDGHFAMPNDPQRAVALSFCLLSAIDDKKIDINQLLSKHFTSNDPYARFCDEILINFKNFVMSLVSDSNAFTVKPKNDYFTSSLADRAEYLARQLETYVKPNARIYLECFIKSAKMRDKQFFLVFFHLFSKKVSRKGKKLLDELASVCEVVKQQ